MRFPTFYIYGLPTCFGFNIPRQIVKDVKRWKPHGKGLVVSLKGVIDRTAADNLVGANVWISKAQLPKAGMDEFYWSDLKGLTVLGLDNEEQEVNLIHSCFRKLRF